jgi:hypothetical protein
MKKLSFFLLLAICAPLASAESIMKPFNDQGYGTVSGRIQSLTMYRDFESTDDNGANSTIGIVLNYTTPEFAGFDAGVGYNFADDLYENNNDGMLVNDDINLLNEGWVRYTFGALSFSNTTLTVGRKINNGEVFRADDFRQKSRSIQAVQLETADIPGNRITVGHTGKMSNWIQAGRHWEFQDYNKVFSIIDKGYTNETDGITWAEVVNTSVDKFEVALFDAYAWDIANLFGTRIQWSFAEKDALIGYYRNESDAGDGVSRSSNVYALSYQKKVNGITVEPGYFGVRGDDLLFQELTTGINHPLGALMEICSCPFRGDSDTAFLKAVTKLESTKTVLYALYNFTWHDHDKQPFNGQEINLVVKQPVAENLTVAFKGGLGHRDGKNDMDDTTDTDVRLTYTF